MQGLLKYLFPTTKVTKTKQGLVKCNIQRTVMINSNMTIKCIAFSNIITIMSGKENENENGS